MLHSEVEEQQGGRALPGMGLFVLVDVVLSIFRGAVAFRTGRFFMNVRNPSGKERELHGAKYRVKIVRDPQQTPPFHGNMVTVRLPLQG
jgi:hypothetical protein